jgi:hypothetical protein
MFIVSGGKGTGKTRTLIARTVAEEGILVCEDPVAMRNRAHRYGITGLNTISYEELYERTAENINRPVFIHDINAFIRHGFSSVQGYSVNTD